MSKSTFKLYNYLLFEMAQLLRKNHIQHPSISREYWFGLKEKPKNDTYQRYRDMYNVAAEKPLTCLGDEKLVSCKQVGKYRPLPVYVMPELQREQYSPQLC